MANVYRYGENILGCFQNGVHYTGFENGAEGKVHREPVTIYGQTLVPGDKITGFDSGRKRTSFALTSGYMTYIGRSGIELYFEVYDPNKQPSQANLFQQRPKWLLTFHLVGSDCGLLMFSQPGAAYDIHPYKILRLTE